MVSKEETSFLPQSLLKERQMMGPGHTFKKTHLWILASILTLLFCWNMILTFKILRISDIDSFSRFMDLDKDIEVNLDILCNSFHFRLFRNGMEEPSKEHLSKATLWSVIRTLPIREAWTLILPILIGSGPMAWLAVRGRSCAFSFSCHALKDLLAKVSLFWKSFLHFQIAVIAWQRWANN